jgi:hypothetical protein
MLYPRYLVDYEMTFLGMFATKSYKNVPISFYMSCLSLCIQQHENHATDFH